MSRSHDDDPEFRSRQWRVALMLGPPAVVALVGALSLWGVLAARGRERVARLAAGAESRVADLVATASQVENAEREFVLTGVGNAVVSSPLMQRAVARDVTAIRAGLDGSPSSEAAIDTLAAAATAALSACDTAVALRRTLGLKPAVLAADERVAHLMARVRAGAVSVGRAAAGLFATRARAAERWHALSAAALGVGTVLAIALGLAVNARLSAAAEREAAARWAAEAARREAEEANRAKSVFLATMSHELRTPLNAIIGFADLLAEEVRGPLTSEQADDVRRIKRAATHLFVLINDVLSFARIEATHVPIAHEVVPIETVLATAGPMIEPQARQKGIVFERRVCDPALAVVADREKVIQILLNLLSNAVKFTPRGGQIVLSCGRSVQESPHSEDRVWIAVRDSGQGIPADQLDRIFEPFVQVGRRLGTEHEGVGLGLAISRTLARAMHGNVFARSAEGEGAEFTLVLPRTWHDADAPSALTADARSWRATAPGRPVGEARDA